MTAIHSPMQVLSMAAIMEIEDPHVYAHSLRVAGYAVTIARRLKLPPVEIAVIEQAGLLHDVGKVSVARSILNKPAQLTEQEYECVKQHSIVGEKVVKKVRKLVHLAPLIRSHHEWYDGSGYPDGIQGANISLGGRIIAVADSFDAMTSNRPYRRARSIIASAKELSDCSGTQFDPVVVKAFLESMKEEQSPWQMLTEGTRSFLRVVLTLAPSAELIQLVST